MGRTSEGWRLWRDPKTGIMHVRFTHEGTRRNLSTGKRDLGGASVAAARVYAEVVSGRQQIGAGPKSITGISFDEVAALWLADIESSVDPNTFRLYRDIYVGTHFAPYFQTIDRLNTVGTEDYISNRLRKVGRATIRKELSALRRFAKWANKRNFLASMPDIETPGARVLGTTANASRKRSFLIFTAEEIERIVSELPERRSAPRAPIPYPVRARFVVAWETALRPATLDKIKAPLHYRRGALTLEISEEDDKNRFGRNLPLSSKARAALDSVCPEIGILFGNHDHRGVLRKAARAAGIDAHRADRISDYDFRHSRLTHLGRVTDNLAGIMYLAGHNSPPRQPGTCAPSKTLPKTFSRRQPGTPSLETNPTRACLQSGRKLAERPELTLHA